jgi:hypothetical protein
MDSDLYQRTYDISNPLCDRLIVELALPLTFELYTFLSLSDL